LTTWQSIGDADGAFKMSVFLLLVRPEW
jgi:hypothetical protein